MEKKNLLAGISVQYSYRIIESISQKSQIKWYTLSEVNLRHISEYLIYYQTVDMGWKGISAFFNNKELINILTD